MIIPCIRLSLKSRLSTHIVSKVDPMDVLPLQLGQWHLIEAVDTFHVTDFFMALYSLGDILPNGVASTTRPTDLNAAVTLVPSDHWMGFL